MPRQRIGNRRHVALFIEHNGNKDDHGVPTYGKPGDWVTVVSGWPCELLTTQGGETVRGRQVTSRTTHVLFGEYFGAGPVAPDMRARVGRDEYNVVAAYDPEGDRKEMRVELRQEH